jgi:hypothetical protein
VLRRSGDALFVPSGEEVGGLQSAIRRERSEQFNPGSHAAVLRRMEGTRISFRVTTK